MRRLTEQDIAAILGRTISGYCVEAAKIKRGPFTDSDHYGIILGRNSRGGYVTWEFHLLDDESVSVYWGHYITEREEALRYYEARGSDAPHHVTVTETFRLTIELEASSRQEAERIVSRDWKRREFVLGPEHFAGVEFTTEPATEQG